MLMEKREAKLKVKILGILSGVSFLASLFFLSPRLTGNTIGGVSSNSASWIGLALIIIASILLYFVVKEI